VNLFVGFSKMLSYTCQKCGKVMKLASDPM
jgi:hypothetical protein